MTEPEDAPALRPGTVIGSRYVVEEKLGEGGMGQVYRATQVNLRRDVALKLLHGNTPDRHGGQRRFMREARVASALRHPHTVEIYDVGIDGAHVFIAMELLTGAVLRDVIEAQGRLPIADAVTLTMQIADLLASAHALPLVHRDLKPENIFVEYDREGRPSARVVDFGLAFIEGSDEMGRLTKEGLVVGTPAFLSPEQAQGVRVGPPADIYSLGCVLYEMLTGQLVFRGSHMNILTQHVYVAPVSTRQRVPDAGIPSDLDDLVMRMLAKRPEQRPSAEGLLDALRSVQGTLTGQRHRGRDDQMLAGRVARMISVPDRPAPTIDQEAVSRVADSTQPNLVVGVLGDFEDSVWFGMASNGLHPERIDDSPDDAPDDAPDNAPDDAPDRRITPYDAVLAVVDDLDRVRALVGRGVPVVAVPPASRVGLLAELLRCGVSDVLTPPVNVDELARKIRRAINRNRRQQRRTR